jgi:hypothetical protein
MSISWKISQLDRNTADGFVTTAHWICIGEEDMGDSVMTASIYASCGFDGELSIPYESLTEATVLQWVWAKVDKDATEAAVLAQIEAQKNPVTASGTPWGN